MQSVWLVTGATSGVGEALVTQILSRGDKVIASGRNVELRLGPKTHVSPDLAFLELDITAPQLEIDAQVKKAWHIFGRIDVLFNNAGRSALKAAEEAEDADVNEMFQVNVFGPMRMTRAVFPFLRAQGGGCVAFTSSSTAWASLPFMTHYASSKAALSVYVEALHKESIPLGIRCVAFECGGMPTLLGQPREEAKGAFGAQPDIEGYQPQFAELMGVFAKFGMDMMPGDLVKVATTMVDVVKREGRAEGKPWATRVPLGSDGWGFASQKVEEHRKVLDEWRGISFGTDRYGQRDVASKSVYKFTTVLEKA
ncbi:hypothetical protein PG995_004519 [Apiospora arundinis]